MNFFAELKRRSVSKVGAASVTATGLLDRAIIPLLCLGLPVALVLA